MATTSYGELLHDVQQRAHQLETQLLISASVSIALFGIIGGLWGAGSIVWNYANKSLAFTFLIILSLPVFSSALARPFVVPTPNHGSGTRSKAIGLELDEYCVRSTATWNRLKKWILVLIWIGLLFNVVVLAGALSEDSDAVALWIVWVFVAFLLGVLSYIVGRAIRLASGKFNREQTCHLRSGVLIDLDGYKPRSCCLSQGAAALQSASSSMQSAEDVSSSTAEDQPTKPSKA